MFNILTEKKGLSKKFIIEKQAGSAIIGVILMAAIAVAIAATVYVFISGVSAGNTDKMPSIYFIADDAENTITCIKASSSDLNWNTDVNISWSETMPYGMPSGTVLAGDQITGISGDNIISITFKGQTLYGTWKFTNQ